MAKKEYVNKLSDVLTAIDVNNKNYYSTMDINNSKKRVFRINHFAPMPFMKKLVIPLRAY